jgi:hypothetical protein
MHKDPNAAGDKVEETLSVFSILAGMPSAYKTTTDILITSGTNEDLTFSNTFSKLIIKELDAEDKTEDGALVARQHRDDRVCYRCGKKGHYIKDCKIFRAEKERNQKSLMAFVL